MYFAQGFKALSQLSVQFFLKDTLGLAPATIQSLLATAALPWSCKPLYGLLSDAFPICGQHRKPYLVLGAVVGVAAWGGLGLVASSLVVSDEAGPHVRSSSARSLLLVLLLLSNLSTALSDVIVDAMVAERCGEAARAAAAAGEDDEALVAEGENALQSLCWGSLAFGGLAGSAIGMVAASAVPVGHIFVLSAACPALVLLASHALPEPTARLGGAGGMGGGMVAIRAAVSALFGAFRLPHIWKPLAFFLLQNAVVPSAGQGVAFFLADELGLGQSFMSLQSLLSFIFLLAGSFVYTRFVEGHGFLLIFYYCQLAAVATSLLDVMLVSRVPTPHPEPNYLPSHLSHPFACLPLPPSRSPLPPHRPCFASPALI